MKKLVVGIVLFCSLIVYAYAADENRVYLPLVLVQKATETVGPLPSTTSTGIAATATATPTATVIPAPNYEGFWTGTTSQGTAISFTVVGSGFQSMQLDYSFDFGSCIVSGPVSFWQLNPRPFTGNTFSVNITSRTSVSGSFDSATTASGTFQTVVNQVGCTGTGTGTWMATKQ